MTCFSLTVPANGFMAHALTTPILTAPAVPFLRPLLARLAQGMAMTEAVGAAKAYITAAIAAKLDVGAKGRGPLNHMVPLPR